MEIKTLVIALVMAVLVGHTADSAPTSLPANDDPALGAGSALGLVVCLKADPFFDPAESLPNERATLLLSDCPEGQEECCPECHSCCNPHPPDYEICCSDCFPTFCSTDCSCQDW